MLDYPKILFPLDFDDTAAHVAEHVATMAARFNSELHVIHVVPTYEHPSFPSYKKVMGEIRAEAEGALNDVLAEHFAGLNLKAEVLTGHTGRQILKYVEENDIALVIMGTHGRTELGKLVFGSVAQRVVQSSAVPVMTINPFGGQSQE